MTQKAPLQSGNSRLWVFQKGPGPGRDKDYMGQWKLGDSSYGFGDPTTIEEPDPNAYGEFIETGEIKGTKERPTFSMQSRYKSDLSDMLVLARRQCKFGVQVLFGRCAHPQDYAGGWEKIRIYPDTSISTWSDENAGAISKDERNPTNESVDCSSRDMYEVVPLNLTEKAADLAIREILDIAICDSKSCSGDCESASTGCEKIFALMKPNSSSPGALPAIIVSKDGGLTWMLNNIDALAVTDTVKGLACVGAYVVVLSDSDNAIAYAETSDILTNVESWTEVTTGFVSTKTPNAISSADARHTWIAAQGGYVYLITDPADGVTVQDAGVATSQHLSAIHALDAYTVVAVGANNAVIYTLDGGASWTSVVGPSVGTSLSAVWVLSDSEWIVGTADGRLFFTTDYGLTWTLIGLPITCTKIQDIEFYDEFVGFMAVATSTKGQILRTIDGGDSWYVLPETEGLSIPANDTVTHIAACQADPNVVYGGGLGDDGLVGIIIQGA